MAFISSSTLNNEAVSILGKKFEWNSKWMKENILGFPYPKSIASPKVIVSRIFPDLQQWKGTAINTITWKTSIEQRVAVLRNKT